MLSRVQLFATPRTVVLQALLSVGFSRQDYWSGLPLSSLGYFPDPGIELKSPALQADSLLSEPPFLTMCYVGHGLKQNSPLMKNEIPTRDC